MKDAEELGIFSNNNGTKFDQSEEKFEQIMEIKFRLGEISPYLSNTDRLNLESALERLSPPNEENETLMKDTLLLLETCEEEYKQKMAFLQRKREIYANIKAIYPQLTEEEKAGMTLQETQEALLQIPKEKSEQLEAFAQKAEAKKQEIEYIEYNEKVIKIQEKLSHLGKEIRKMYAPFLLTLNDLKQHNPARALGYADSILNFLKFNPNTIEEIKQPEKVIVDKTELNKNEVEYRAKVLQIREKISQLNSSEMRQMYAPFLLTLNDLKAHDVGRALTYADSILNFLKESANQQEPEIEKIEDIDITKLPPDFENTKLDTEATETKPKTLIQEEKPANDDPSHGSYVDDLKFFGEDDQTKAA